MSDDRVPFEKELAFEPPKRRGCLRTGGIGCGVLVGLLLLVSIIGAIFDGGSNKSTPASHSAAGPSTQPATPTTPTATAEPTSPAAIATLAPTTEPTPSPIPTTPPTPTPTPTAEQIKAQYSRDVDIRDLVTNVDKYKGQKLYYEGTVLTIFVTGKTSQIQVDVPWPGSGKYDSKTIIVVTDQDTTGIHEKDSVGVWGRPQKNQTFKNSLGGEVSQPLLQGDYVEKLPPPQAISRTAVPSPTPTPVPSATIGQTLVLPRLGSVTVYQIKRPVQDAKGLFKPSPGNEYVGVEVEECAPDDLPSGKTVESDTYDFWLASSDNPKLFPSLAGVTPPFESKQLSHGVCERGWLTYELRKDATVVAVKLQAIRVDAGLIEATWTVGP